jgi:transmembrane sensor
MRMADSEQPTTISERVNEEARAWVARLASGGIDDAELERFHAWRALSDAHREAFARERAFWQQLQALEPASVRGSRRLISRRRLLIGGGAMAAAAVGAVFAPDIRLLFEADYRTGVGEQLGVTLPDGSAVTLNTDSALALDYRSGLRLVHLLRGEALFEVKVGGPPFRVAALGGAAETTAGSFAVRTVDEEASVLLMQGRATVFGPIAPAAPVPTSSLVELTPNLETGYRQGGAPARPIAFDADAELAWRSGRVIFDGKPFGRALAELGRYVRERLVLADRSRTGEPVSAIFSISQAHEAIVALARTQGLSVRRIPGVVIYIS